MLPYSELEYGGIVKILDEIDHRFAVLEPARAAATATA